MKTDEQIRHNMSILTDESLQYVIEDCSTAISANPLNPKCFEYLKTIQICQEMLFKRDRKRALRSLQNIQSDPLAYRQSLDRLSRRATIRNPYRLRFGTMQINHAKEAALNLGCERLATLAKSTTKLSPG